MTGRLARVLAAVILAALCVFWGWRAGLAYTARPPDYNNYGTAQLPWVEEGILERISKLEDELAQVRDLREGIRTD